MTWQIIILAQVLVSALMTVFTRKLSLADHKLFFVIGGVSYGVVALMGIVYSFLFGVGVTKFPSSVAWPFLITEGVFIPISWLLQYKIIRHFGAGNAVLISALNYVGTASLGFIVFREYFSVSFLVGFLLILASIVVAFKIQPDTVHRQTASTRLKISLVVVMVATFALGMAAEKQAINVIGVWQYAQFGWTLQFIGAAGLLALFGRSELTHVTRKKLRGGAILGILTSVAGVLYIYALSLGSLSHTIVAASGKIALVMLFAALFLNERNDMKLRITSFVMSVFGLILLFL